MNLSLTINFDSMEELRAYVGEPAPAVAPVAAVVEPAPEPVAAVAPVVDEAEEIDLAVLRTDLHSRMSSMANSMDDPSVLGKFINGFGVARFSDLKDEDLVAFKAAFEGEFGL